MKVITQIVCAIFVMGLVACTSNESTSQTATKPEAKKTNVAPEPAQKAYKIGDTVADFKLENIDGKMVALSDYEDEEGVILIFTCNHCPYAVMYEDRISDIHNTFAAKGYPVLAINPNDPELVPEDDMEGMKKRAEEKDFKFAYLMDEGQKIFPKFGATRTPEVFLLKNDGGAMKIAYTGAIDDNYKDAKAVKAKYLEDALEAVTNGKQPNPDFTKAVGCTIKYKKS